VDLASDELLLKLALVVALGAMPSNTLELSGELSGGPFLESCERPSDVGCSGFEVDVPACRRV